MSPEQVALRHYRDRRRLIQAVATAARDAWRQIDPANIARSWQAELARLLVTLVGAQRAAAQEADGYLAAVLAAQGVHPEPVGLLVPSSLTGVASDGRLLDSLLYQPVVTSLTVIGQGTPVGRALAGGYVHLDMIVRTQVADAGRVADQVATVARPQVSGYVRMVVGRTCGRCLILAGRRYKWNQGFRRHPRCDCIHIPAAEDTAGDLRTDPRAAFRAMTPAEQDQAFGVAGAEAIRAGADMARVVNARRGMYEAGGRLLTREATTRRGIGRPIRLMPEQILREANGNRDEALRLLRLHGYLR